VAKISPRGEATLFVILDPPADQPVQVDGAGTVLVRVRAGGTGLTFQATITDVGSSTTVYGSGALAQQGTTNVYSARLGAGPVPPAPTGTNNRTVHLQAFRGSMLADQEARDFEAFGGGSGSFAPPARAHRCPFCREDRPVPVELRVRFEAPVGCLWAWLALLRRLRGRPPLGPALREAVLVHSPRAGAECCWLGEPLAAFSDRDDPAFWLLQKSSPRNWGLSLRRGDSDLVAFRLTTAEMDCSFPITLSLAAGAEGAGWPRAVTVFPA
jgi:hypothetical protein